MWVCVCIWWGSEVNLFQMLRDDYIVICEKMGNIQVLKCKQDTKAGTVVSCLNSLRTWVFRLMQRRAS